MFLSPKVSQIRNVSRFCPETEALAPNHEHWEEHTWANRSASGVLELEVVNTPPWRGFSSKKGLLWSRPGGHACTPAIPLRRRPSPPPWSLTARLSVGVPTAERCPA